MKDDSVSDVTDSQKLIADSVDRSNVLTKKANTYGSLFRMCYTFFYGSIAVFAVLAYYEVTSFPPWVFSIPFIFLFGGLYFSSRKTKALCKLIDEDTLRIKLQLNTFVDMIEIANFFESRLKDLKEKTHD